jgi:ATP-dependent exoDNAse (exonuclease V) alpha subunit
MTYNKCQGQTLSKVLLDISTSPFAHGHLYVALSRVRSVCDICLFIDNTDMKALISGDYKAPDIPIVNNIFHQSILDKIVFA